MALRDQSKANLDGRTSIKQLYTDVFSGDSWKLTIPAALYTLQNNLQYIAVSNLSAASFQVTYQLKILTTALCSVIILNRTLSATKWGALVLLTIGVAIVQLNTAGPSPSTPPSNPAEKVIRASMPRPPPQAHITHRTDEMDPFVGLVAVVIACVISGVAGVYFEKVLKGSTTSLWVRNVQLSFYSLFPALFIGVLWKDGANVAEKGFFFGYNVVVWAAIICQALGGIIVALVVKYADNILKGFATSVSILLSFLASVILFDFQVTLQFMLGGAIVLGATYLYNQPETPTTPNPQKDDNYIEVATFDKTEVMFERDSDDFTNGHAREPSVNSTVSAGSRHARTTSTSSASRSPAHARRISRDISHQRSQTSS